MQFLTALLFGTIPASQLLKNIGVACELTPSEEHFGTIICIAAMANMYVQGQSRYETNETQIIRVGDARVPMEDRIMKILNFMTLNPRSLTTMGNPSFHSFGQTDNCQPYRSPPALTLTQGIGPMTNDALFASQTICGN